MALIFQSINSVKSNSESVKYCLFGCKELGIRKETGFMLYYPYPHGTVQPSVAKTFG